MTGHHAGRLEWQKNQGESVEHGEYLKKMINIASAAGRLAERRRNMYWCFWNLMRRCFMYFGLASLFFANSTLVEITYVDSQITGLTVKLAALALAATISAIQMAFLGKLENKDRKFLETHGYKIAGSGKGLHLLYRENHLKFFKILDH